TGVFYGMRAALPALLARGGGSIITTSSVDGLFGEIMAAPSPPAKAAVINLTRTVAVEYGRRNIRANCICPGAVETPLLDLIGQLAPKPRAPLGAEHALGRCLRPEEIANVALFLASDESSAITGAAIVADGGLTAGLGVTGFPPYGAGAAVGRVDPCPPGGRLGPLPTPGPCADRSEGDRRVSFPGRFR